ncbi:CaiB/BaiF CoA-transferase family protein [Ottowia sp.]|uniref:CaiB/BaiF CoA-transferase family protein n=2 Tax=Ottowia sp. TaxID=1898956 RepID=UPI002BC0046E|nr:CaiB/BaiF CoA-transferase family protein [Ottowia sp.]HOB65515.1 CaiB/BaiF CoA-transferase family protein [Ottowia sp.]HPZ57245.1 CaiB/BaiF CoA-transferase family protein [Ottowia sp.]
MATRSSARPLTGTRIVSLALNLPGPAALMRLAAMGARCLKVEPPGPGATASGRPISGDPMGQYDIGAYSVMHEDVRVIQLDLKTERGQAQLARELLRADLLLTSFRPSALTKLGLDWKTLRRSFGHLSMVEIVGAPGERADEPGHDLTYLAEAGLVTGTELPPTLLADMAGALMASEAALSALMQARASGRGQHRQVALSSAAEWLALPRTWGLTLPSGAVGGAHAGYRVYACKDGRVAIAALEPHFARALFAAAGLPEPDLRAPFAPQAREAIAAWALTKTRRQLDALAAQHDIPLHTLSK